MKIFVCVNFNYADNWGNVFGFFFWTVFQQNCEHVFITGENNKRGQEKFKVNYLRKFIVCIKLPA